LDARENKSAVATKNAIFRNFDEMRKVVILKTIWEENVPHGKGEFQNNHRRFSNFAASKRKKASQLRPDTPCINIKMRVVRGDLP
jgi:hypothetical protein